MRLVDPIRAGLALMTGAIDPPPLIPQRVIPPHEAEGTKLLMESIERVQNANPPDPVPLDLCDYVEWIP